uniref:Plastocyanin-like domain-containing protein n=1 Tax=Chlamydomonas euryale TaxID=1486919 RepID=A0A7R9VU19_9CHLO|mmetsp:Transcript_4441/g.12853  ORF Transcript_4441/g.12853 Transcript_4441/m.12853 type:complete len:126 (+) Transcript_4441:188-565(+)
MQQHPMHLHGHKFWLLGMGPGVYDPAVHEPTLNKYNPIFRDTMTLPVGYWAVLRFRADNPGVWPFHCHNLWHAFMGQQMYIVEGAGRWPARPEGFNKCSDKCIFNFGSFTNDWFDSMFSKKYDHA